MKSRDLPEVVKATFGVRSHLGVKVLTSATPLPKEHKLFWPISNSTSAPDRAHPILRCASQNYHYKSQIPNPEPCLSGGLGQQ